MNTVPVSAVLVPTNIFAQQDGSLVQAIPISGQVLLAPTSQVSENGMQKFHYDSRNLGPPSNPVVKTSTKGRRPKSLATEIKSEFNPEFGMGKPMCRACGKYFMSRQQLNQHMLVHSDVRKYKCTYCDRSFKQPSHLHQHHRIHTGEKPYRCTVPGCSRAFPQQSNLNHHLRNHDKPAPPPENTCSLCMRVYASETVLRTHIAKIHACDPDTLLGERKKTPNTEQVPHETPSLSLYSGTQYKKIKQEIDVGTCDTVQVTEISDPSNNTSHTNIAKIVNAFSLKNPASSQNFDIERHNFSETSMWKNGFYSSQKVFQNIPNATNGNHSEDSEMSVRPKFANCNNGEQYRYIENSKCDLPNNSAATATFDSRENINTSGTEENYTFVNSENDIVSERSWYDKSAYSQLDNRSNSSFMNEPLPSQAGRSRKRKAFQPQRIVQMRGETNEQGCVDV